MLKAMIWGSLLYGGNREVFQQEVVHRGHITVTPPIDHSVGLGWFLFIALSIPFLVIGVPIILIYIDMKRHPNKPVRKVAKK